MRTSAYKYTLSAFIYKQILLMQKIIGANLSEEEVKKIYNSFVKNQQKAFLYVTENVRSVADPILNLEGDNQDRMNDLLLQVASSANIFKIMTKKFTDLQKNVFSFVFVFHFYFCYSKLFF